MYHIAFASGNNFIKYAGVVIASILVNSKQNEQLFFHVLDGGISETNKQKILSLKKLKKFEIEFVPIDFTRLKDCPLGYSAPEALVMYARICIPSLLPKIDKLLCLDCDMVVTQSLEELFNIDIENYYVAAVEDSVSSRWAARLNFSDKKLYFNAGMLLINCKKWRKENIEQKALDYIKTNKAKLAPLHDQDVYNALFVGKVKFLSKQFNLQYHPSYGKSRGADYSDMQEAINSPVIIHYASPDKPWFIFSRHPFRTEYFKYLKLTPWKNEKYPWREQVHILARPFRVILYWQARKIKNLKNG